MDTADGKLITRGRLRLDLLEKLSRRPRLFANRERDFWRDPYISRHVLEAHLDTKTDDATRRPARVGATIERIFEHVSAPNEAEGLRVLDLACGPGIYAEQFAARGCAVTGMDFSEPSIEYARSQAMTQGLEIDYRLADIRTARFHGPYDLILLIYGALSTLSNTERRSLIGRAYRALAPGGLLVFDVFTEAYARRNRARDDWYVSVRDGFWQEAPHLVLERNFFYQQHSASVARYLIVSEKGDYRLFNVWWRHFTRDEITAAVEEEGFLVEAVYGSLWGDAHDADGEWIGVYARKPT